MVMLKCQLIYINNLLRENKKSNSENGLNRFRNDFKRKFNRITWSNSSFIASQKFSFESNICTWLFQYHLQMNDYSHRYALKSVNSLHFWRKAYKKMHVYMKWFNIFQRITTATKINSCGEFIKNYRLERKHTSIAKCIFWYYLVLYI